jgi:hypothetical protein
MRRGIRRGEEGDGEKKRRGGRRFVASKVKYNELLMVIMKSDTAYADRGGRFETILGGSA